MEGESHQQQQPKADGFRLLVVRTASSNNSQRLLAVHGVYDHGARTWLEGDSHQQQQPKADG